jgi:hypothetical protein
MTTSKSPRRVLQVAYGAACQALPAPRHRFRPQKFTQPQLLACWVLTEFLRLDSRGRAEHLADHSALTRSLALEVIPHFTTFPTAAARLLRAAPARALCDAVLDRALRDQVRQRRVPRAAIDGTGRESRHTSRSDVKRRSRTGSDTQETPDSKDPKVILVTDGPSHRVPAAVPGRGPGSDLRPFQAAVTEAAGRARIGTLLGEAASDAEWVHEPVRETDGIRTIIPPGRGRPSEEPPVGRWRRWLRQQFARFKARSGQRWPTETVHSLIPRRLGSALRARTSGSQCREIILRAITPNTMIVANG